MHLFKQIKEEPLLIIFGLSWLCKLIHSNLHFSPFEVTDPDGYFSSFNFFLEHGYYETMSNGSSYLFNCCNYLFYVITGNISFSFFLTNALSELALIIIGFKIIKLINLKYNSKYILIILAFYLFNTLDLNDYHHSNNDIFQAVFIALIIYFLVKQYLSENFKAQYYLYIALLSVICTLIRPTSLVVIVMVILSVFLLEFLKKTAFYKILIRLLIVALPIIIFISVLHFPSLNDHRTLGFYNKSTKTDNWVQRNYLATKQMQIGDLPIHKNSIFRETKFNKVNEYIKKNGENSLPKTQGAFLKKDPVLISLLFVYNTLFTFLKASRYYGVLIILPLVFLLFKPIIYEKKLFIYIWGIVVGVLCFIPFTLMEYRWFTGYDLLFVLSIFSAIHFFEISKYKKALNFTIKLSLIMVSGFNLLLTFFLSSSY